MRYIAAEDVAKAKEMEKYITDERTGLKYELVGDYYLVVGDDEPEEDQPIRIWGQRHLRHLKRRHKVIYANLLTSGKLPEYLADMQDCKRLVDGFLLTGKIQIFGFAAILGLGNAKHPRIIQIRWEGLSVIIPYQQADGALSAAVQSDSPCLHREENPLLRHQEKRRHRLYDQPGGQPQPVHRTHQLVQIRE